MKPLRYFFFRNYELNIKQGSSTPWLRPLALLSALVGLNALVVIWICYELWGDATTIAQRESVSKVSIVVWSALVFVALYFRWIRSGRYLTFKEEFAGESGAARKVRTVLLFAYAIASFCAPAIAGYWVFVRDH